MAPNTDARAGKQAASLLITATAATVWAVALGGMTGLLVGWAALGYAVMAGAHLHGPRLIGKRADGSLPPAALLALAGANVVARLLILGYRAATRSLGQAPALEVAPGVLLSAFPTAIEAKGLERLGVTRVLDLTAELVPSAWARRREYRCVPVLDGTAPSLAQLREAMAFLAAGTAGGGRTLVHCALGRGRSATIVVAWLMECGAARSVEGALAMARAAGGRVDLTAAQRRLLDSAFAAHKSLSSTASARTLER